MKPLLCFIIFSTCVNLSYTQILSASITNIVLKENGTCSDIMPRTEFHFNLTVDVVNPSDTYSYHLIDGNNRVMGWQLALTGDRNNELRAVGLIQENSIAPFRIIILYPSTFISSNVQVDPLVIDYSSEYFNPHLLDADCPDIICKGSAMDSTYFTSPPDQTIPVYIDRDLELNNFSLSHDEDFFAGQSVLLSSGYDSGLLGTISSYDIMPCTIQTWTPCWDLNNNGMEDDNEDVNNDGETDTIDCN